MSVDPCSLADCLDCEEVAVGDALAWAVEHTEQTGHSATAHGIDLTKGSPNAL